MNTRNATIAVLGISLLMVGGVVWNKLYRNPAQNTLTILPGTNTGVPTPVSNIIPISPDGTINNGETVQTAGAPIVETDPAAVPSISTVVVRGTVNPNGAPATYWYEYGETAALGIRTSEQSIGSGFQPIFAPAYITGLKANTTYSYRLMAKNRLGTVTGSTFTFRTNTAPATQGTLPTGRTNSAIDITRSSATLRGVVDPNGSDTTYWFEYGPTSELGSLTSFRSAGGGNSAQNVSAAVSNLAPMTRYFFRVNAQNRFGTANGEIMSFSTQGPVNPSVPAVNTDGSSEITAGSARVNGRVNPNGVETAYWFEYSTEPGLTSISTSPEQTLNAAGALITVSANLANLLSGTTYYYRVVARNQFGITRGEINSFVTNS